MRARAPARRAPPGWRTSVAGGRGGPHARIARASAAAAPAPEAGDGDGPSTSAAAPEAPEAPAAAGPPKEALLAKLGSSGKAITSGSKADRVAVSELLPLVEKDNPTVAPASSSKLEGKWRFRYCGSPAPGPVMSPTREIALLMYAGGYSPGLFGYDVAAKLPSSLVDVGEVTIEIGASQPRALVTAEVSVLGRQQTVKISEEIDAESETRISERYVEVDALGQSYTLPPPLRYSRSLFVTYVDDELLVVRDESGCPEILTRVADAPEAAPLESAIED